MAADTDAPKARDGASASWNARARSETPAPIGIGPRDVRAGAVEGGGIVACIISAIGVMPAIGSVAKLPREYDTAPINWPSM